MWCFIPQLSISKYRIWICLSSHSVFGHQRQLLSVNPVSYWQSVDLFSIWWSIFVTATGKTCMKKWENPVMHSYLNQRPISDNFLVKIKLSSGLTTPGRSENNLRTDLDHLSSKLNFLILYDLVNFGNVIKALQVSFY